MLMHCSFPCFIVTGCSYKDTVCLWSLYVFPSFACCLLPLVTLSLSLDAAAAAKTLAFEAV